MAALFSATSHGNRMWMDTARDGVQVAIALENDGDIPIQVSASLAGMEIEPGNNTKHPIDWKTLLGRDVPK